jgi:L-lactate dehydrogenase
LTAGRTKKLWWCFVVVTKRLNMKHVKIAIVGVGAVGSTVAYTLILQNLASEIILVDIDKEKCAGEWYDLSDELSFSSTARVTVGALEEAGRADIVIIAAGVAQKSGQPREYLLDANYPIIKQIFAGMMPLNPDLIVIMVTNPVDTLRAYPEIRDILKS